MSDAFLVSVADADPENRRVDGRVSMIRPSLRWKRMTDSDVE